MNRRTIALILLICQLSYPASAGFYEGLIAAQKEDWETALAEWLPIANEGNPGAQSNIGNMYAHGLGVEKDIFEALESRGILMTDPRIQETVKDLEA